MANTYSILAQLNPAINTTTVLYTAVNPTIVSTIVVCNTGGVPSSFCISVAVAGASIVTKQYLYYMIPINNADTFCATLGITLAATDVIRVYATTADLVFNAFGTEIV